MKIILSIKPEFANRIFEGTKKFEFRRTIFKHRCDVKTVVVYASAPISKIIGEFDVEEILHNQLALLWEETQEYAGINENYFNAYFTGKEEGFAIKISNPKKYSEYIDIREKYGVRAPQSFVYIK